MTMLKLMLYYVVFVGGFKIVLHMFCLMRNRYPRIQITNAWIDVLGLMFGIGLLLLGIAALMDLRSYVHVVETATH